MKKLLFVIVGCVLLSCNKDNFDPDPDQISYTYREPNKVYIYCVTASPTVNESITIKNNSGGTVDISGWTLGNLNDPGAYSIPAGIILIQGEQKTFLGSTLNFAINDSGERIYLKNPAVTIDSWNN